jgi:predicted DNA-binding transcriptional regulator AlpA
MTKEELNRLPLLLGWKQVEACLGISRPTWYRYLKKGRLRHPTKFGAINKWRKDYIFWLLENGIEPVGTYPPFNEDEGTPEATKPSAPVPEARGPAP